MNNGIRKWFRRVTGIATPFGGVSWDPKGDEYADIPRFKETVYVTLAENEFVIDFLRQNDGRLVFLNAYLDASVVLEEQQTRVEENGIDLDRIGAGQFNGLPISLPNRKGTLISVTFHFRDGHVLNPSHGGTGILMVKILGFFEVSTTFHGGPSTAFHLKEIDAPVNVRAQFMNQTRGPAER